MVKLGRKGNHSFVVTIPIEKIIERNWNYGDILVWKDYPNGDLVLRKVDKR